MYHTRFTQWGLHKNYKAGDKELLAAQIARACSEKRPATNIKFRGQPVKFRKVIRHCLSQKRVEEANKIKSIDPSRSAPHPHREDMSSSSPLASIGLSKSPSNLPSFHTPVSAVTPQSIRTPTSSATPESCKGSSLHEASTIDPVPPSTEVAIRYKLTPSSPSPPLSFPTNTTNLEVILQQTAAYYKWHFQTFHSTGDPLKLSSLPITNESPSVLIATLFWNKIKSAIYFLKIGSQELAWPLLSQACAMVADLLVQYPMAILRDIFATISPVNTRICPEVRVQLLQYLAVMSKIKFGGAHPLTLICHHLQMDAGSRKISETALRLMLDVFQESLGQAHWEVFQLRRTLIVLLRRDRDFSAAETLSIALVHSSEQASGQNYMQTRLAMSELVHIYNDQGDYNRATDICEEVLRRSMLDLGHDYPDSRCVHAMEDMAELCDSQGNTFQSEFWLRKAFSGALKVWGKGPLTTHILDKLSCALLKNEQHQESVLLRQGYSSLSDLGEA